VIISADRLELTDSNSHLAYSRIGSVLSLSWIDGGQNPSLYAERTAAAFDPGQLELDVGGQWRFTEAGADGWCDATLVPASASMVCQNGPTATPEQIFTLTRAEQRASIFGDLGGVWNITVGGETCTATLEGQTARASCSTEGSAEVTFSGNMASGSTSEGIEFSGQRLQ
jgi:hypothetical protein